MRMHWLFWIGATVAMTAGAAAVIGALLPVRHHATRSARFCAAPEALYAVLAGPPDWRTGIKSFGVLPESEGRRRWWEEDSHRHKIAYELVEELPGRRLRVRIAQPGLPFGGTWTFDLAPLAAGSELRISEDGEIYNVFFRFMARFIFGYYGSIDQYLRDLGVKFAQPVEIEA
jgi:hypothetical protein